MLWGLAVLVSLLCHFTFVKPLCLRQCPRRQWPKAAPGLLGPKKCGSCQDYPPRSPRLELVLEDSHAEVTGDWGQSQGLHRRLSLLSTIPHGCPGVTVVSSGPCRAPVLLLRSQGLHCAQLRFPEPLPSPFPNLRTQAVLRAAPLSMLVHFLGIRLSGLGLRFLEIRNLHRLFM